MINRKKPRMASASGIKILLISPYEADTIHIRTRLERSTNFRYFLWSCTTLDEAFFYLNRKLRVDIIILDLGIENIYSAPVIYGHVRKFARDTPIIVLTGENEEDHKNATAAMEAGASDHLVRGEFSGLLDAIECGLIRQDVAIKISEIRDRQQEDSNALHRMEVQAIRKDNKEQIRQKNQVITWMTGGYSASEDDHS